jgi:hypothetical protein
MLFFATLSGELALMKTHSAVREVHPVVAPAAGDLLAVASGGRPGFSDATSFNYSVAKVVAIFTVVLGHWFGGLLWIPVTYGLYLFAFSSGFFTMKIYGQRVDRQKFWRKKLERLGLRFWVILAVLTVIVALQGKTVLHWHTLVHFAGLSGVLNWIPVPNRSGLGGGLWFFTLLLIFYLAYPYLALMRRSRTGAAVVAVGSVVAAIWLEETVKVGHELWLTALGFILGVAYAAHEVRIRPLLSAAVAFLSCLALLTLNALVGYNGLNTVLITMTSMALAIWLVHAELPRNALTSLIARFDKYLLEIFLMHTYLFVRITGNGLADFAMSLAVVMLVSAVVHRWANILSQRVLDRGTARTVAQT